VGYLHWQISELDDFIDGENRYIHNEFVREKSAEIDAVSARTAYYNSIISQKNTKDAFEQNLARLSEETLDLIMNAYPQGVRVTSFDYNESSGAVRLSGSSATEKDSELYTSVLKVNPLIASVRYTGYNYGNDGSYNFSIEVILARQEPVQ
jgi:hypothetical protein